MKEENAKLKAEIEHFQKDKQEMEKQKTKIDSNAHEIFRLKAENEKLKVDIKTLQNKKQDTEELSKVKKENDKLKADIKALQNKMKDTEELSKVKKENDKLKADIKALQNKMKDTEELSKVKKENDKLKDDIKALQNKMKDTVELSKMKKENEELKLKIEHLKNDKKLESQEKFIQSKEFQILDIKFVENLNKIEYIGSGGGGRVFKVSFLELYALKEMNTESLDTNKLKSFIGEYEILNMLRHPNIIKTIGIYLSDEKNPPSILLEYLPMNLSTAIKNKIFTKEQAVFCIYQIAEGMKYVHFNHVIHRDLKPANILVSADGTIIKICDFGISKLITLEEQSMTRNIGTQKFMAPEIINEEDHYNEKVDVYSFGVVVFFILSGGQIPKIKVGDILKGMKAEIPSTFTELAKEIINECWNFNAKDRPSFSMILEKMEKNNYNLLDLKDTEMKYVKSLIKQHKSKIQPYGK